MNIDQLNQRNKELQLLVDTLLQRLADLSDEHELLVNLYEQKVGLCPVVINNTCVNRPGIKRD